MGHSAQGCAINILGDSRRRRRRVVWHSFGIQPHGTIRPPHVIIDIASPVGFDLRSIRWLFVFLLIPRIKGEKGKRHASIRISQLTQYVSLSLPVLATLFTVSFRRFRVLVKSAPSISTRSFYPSLYSPALLAYVLRPGCSLLHCCLALAPQDIGHKIDCGYSYRWIISVRNSLSFPPLRSWPRKVCHMLK